MTGTGRERMLAGIRAGMARQAERRGGSTAPAKPTPLIPARATAVREVRLATAGAGPLLVRLQLERLGAPGGLEEVTS